MEPFSYHLPVARIAQRPWDPPDEARLLVVDRRTQAVYARRFTDLTDFLEPGDLLVFNDTRVIPARLFGTVGDRDVEVLLVREIGKEEWNVLGRPMKMLRKGVDVVFSDVLQGRVEAANEETLRCRFTTTDNSPIKDALWRVGSMPIPPYIRGGRADPQDVEDYQTIFARREGSVAAPTASLHFTERLLDQCRERGVQTTFLTLHVGTASFLPVYRGSGPEVQGPGSEQFEIPEATRSAVLETGRSGHRVIAVGTTVARALESMGRDPNWVRGETDIFISPGFQWQIATNLVTNFHQPGTSHLLLVESLLGRDLLSRAYSFAIDHEFRFLSYGDGMIIL